MRALLDKVAGRVRLMVGRAILQVVDDARLMQSVQVMVSEGEVRDLSEHFQHYGFSSVPHPGAEGIGLAVGGSTDHMVVHGLDDRRYRPKALAEGEVCLYTDEDGGTGEHRIHFKRGKIIEIHCGASTSIVIAPGSITLTAAAVNIIEG